MLLYCHENCVNLVWMLYLGMRGTSVLNIDCYWLNERVCVNCPLVRAVTDTRHLSVSWMMCWLQLDTWAQDAVWCGPLVTKLPALKSLKRIPELWIIHISNTPTFRLIVVYCIYSRFYIIVHKSPTRVPRYLALNFISKCFEGYFGHKNHVICDWLKNNWGNRVMYHWNIIVYTSGLIHTQ